VTLSELISMRIPGTKLRMPVSWYHNVIKRWSALFHWRDRQFGHARLPAVLYSICYQPATRTRNSWSQTRDRHNVTMSSA